MSSRIDRPFVPALVALALVGCAPRLVTDRVASAWRSPGRMAVDAPARFVVPEESRVSGAPASGCASRLVDRRYGVELTLVRASDAHDKTWRGDYRASAPQRYAAADGELVRVECATGFPLGLVGSAALAVDSAPR